MHGKLNALADTRPDSIYNITTTLPFNLLIRIFVPNKKALGKSEIKCKACGQWTPGNQTHCVHCGELVDHQIIDQQEREQRSKVEEERRKAAETKFEKLLKRLQQSENPFYRIIYGVLNVVWMIYMGLVSFVIWFTAIFSG